MVWGFFFNFSCTHLQILVLTQTQLPVPDVADLVIRTQTVVLRWSNSRLESLDAPLCPRRVGGVGRQEVPAALCGAVGMLWSRFPRCAPAPCVHPQPRALPSLPGEVCWGLCAAGSRTQQGNEEDAGPAGTQLQLPALKTTAGLKPGSGFFQAWLREMLLWLGKAAPLCNKFATPLPVLGVFPFTSHLFHA